MKKKLIVTLKTPNQALEDFKRALKKARNGKKVKSPHLEISFDNRKDFERFIRNIDILMTIQSLKPASIYELSKMINKDQGNLTKLIAFFSDCGAIKIKEEKIKSRLVKRPIVEYKSIEFEMNVA